MKIRSNAFGNGQMIPRKYTCNGENVNPPLEISGVPSEAKSLALIVHDVDAQVPGGWTHWTVFNIDPKKTKIAENNVPAGAILGHTSFGIPGYGGPCPPSGTHHYEFRLYALDDFLALDEKAGKVGIERAMAGHVIDKFILMGLYQHI